VSSSLALRSIYQKGRRRIYWRALIKRAINGNSATIRLVIAAPFYLGAGLAFLAMLGLMGLVRE